MLSLLLLFCCWDLRLHNERERERKRQPAVCVAAAVAVAAGIVAAVSYGCLSMILSLRIRHRARTNRLMAFTPQQITTTPPLPTPQPLPLPPPVCPPATKATAPAAAGATACCVRLCPSVCLLHLLLLQPINSAFGNDCLWMDAYIRILIYRCTTYCVYSVLFVFMI